MKSLKIKRIYLPPAPDDGYRVLVDRLWPRGISRAKAELGGWLKDIAPSASLRKSFAHQAEHFAEFEAAYRDKLDSSPQAAAFAQTCKAELASRNVTLLYAAKDGTCSNAAVLSEWLKQHMEINSHI